MFKNILNAIYPTRCIICKDFTKSSFYICDECMPKLEIITKTTCRKCGLLKENCECNRFIYHFKGIVSPFFNEDAAKAAFYSFKFHGAIDASKFFSNYMAQFIKKRFKNIQFDAVIAIPMTKIATLDRGYNQAEVLAKDIANILNLKYHKGALKKIKKTKIQHEQFLEQRFLNIRNVFDVSSSFNPKDKTILLIDDIKTTGASLDEASRILLLNGAKEIYCATALITK